MQTIYYIQCILDILELHIVYLISLFYFEVKQYIF